LLVHRTTAQPSGLWVRLAQLFSHTHTGIHGVVVDVPVVVGVVVAVEDVVVDSAVVVVAVGVVAGQVGI